MCVVVLEYTATECTANDCRVVRAHHQLALVTSRRLVHWIPSYTREILPGYLLCLLTIHCKQMAINFGFTPALFNWFYVHLFLSDISRSLRVVK